MQKHQRLCSTKAHACLKKPALQCCNTCLLALQFLLANLSKRETIRIEEERSLVGIAWWGEGVCAVALLAAHGSSHPAFGRWAGDRVVVIGQSDRDVCPDCSAVACNDCWRAAPSEGAVFGPWRRARAFGRGSGDGAFRREMPLPLLEAEIGSMPGTTLTQPSAARRVRVAVRLFAFVPCMSTKPRLILQTCGVTH